MLDKSWVNLCRYVF